jgi:hypothetical protein
MNRGVNKTITLSLEKVILQMREIDVSLGPIFCFFLFRINLANGEGILSSRVKKVKRNSAVLPCDALQILNSFSLPYVR